MAIYVETVIDVPIEELWQHTQQPALHQRWDLRFSAIDYLSRGSDSGRQRFLYTTRLAGLAVSGEGETVGYRKLADGSQASALRFWSGHPLSLIREGSGYWKYVPTHGGIRFLTAYDYRTRFGLPGRLVDRLLFRPLMGWATAWSFDRLRLWLEDGVAPEASARMAVVHAVARVALVAVFVYHALFLKLIWASQDEAELIAAAGIDASSVPSVMVLAGFAELALAACLLLFWSRPWPSVVCAVFAVAATVGVALTSPDRFGAAFNPASLNLGILALAVVDLVVMPAVPSARRTVRRPRR